MPTVQRRPARSRLSTIFGVLCILLPACAMTPAAWSQEPAPQAPAAAPKAPAGDAAAPATKPAEAPAASPGAAGAKPLTTIPIVYLGKQYAEPLPLSYAEDIVTDKGIQGARLGITEGTQAGRFVNQAFTLDEAIIPADGDIVAKAKEVLGKGERFIIADLEPKDLIAVADLPEAENALIMNVRSSATSLRQDQCRTNVLHIIPDYAMRADALAQYLIWKKWPRWYVVRGDTPEDKDYFEQVKRSAGRYGGKVVGEKVYDLPPGARNLDSGHQQVQSQIPMVTQSAPDHDVVWVLDSGDNFGDYLMYRTATPRPVVGTQGLQAVAWDPSYTESGAMRFQNRIKEMAHRPAKERDYTAWLGVRSITDGALRSGKTKPAELQEFLLSDQFKLEAAKGQALSFRTWDNQMRQPIILGGGTRVPVSMSPQEGFLHPTNLTDTLGFDEAETKCDF